MLQAGPLISSLSPSFNTASNGYSSTAAAGNLADIAARVVSELRRDNPDAATAFLFDVDDDDDQPWLRRKNPDAGDGDESEFSFSFSVAASPISADEVFLNGRIRPVYPLFGKPLLDLEETVETGGNDKTTPPLQSSSQLSPPPRRRQPLGKLMVEDREWPPSTSCSSSEGDELDGLRPDTYCVWAPNNKPNISADRKKSRSTGTTTTTTGSRRWKLRDLILNRSSSDGGPGPGPGPKEEGPKKGGKVVAEEAEEKKKKPYKQDLVGFLSNVNGLSRNLHPF